MWIYRNLNPSLINRKKKSTFLKIVIGFFAILLVIAISITSYIASLFYLYSSELPQTEDIVITREESSRIFDRDGNLLSVMYLTEQRIYVPLKDISKAAQDAIVASEDERFYLHEGIDLKAILRAFYTNVLSQDLSQGGSTITQQLARNVFLNQEKTYTRKLKEVILSFRIEEVYKKSEILEMYLNQCYFGEGCYGIETAARKFFNVHASELDIAQASILAAVLPSPSELNVYTTFDSVKRRQKTVLQKMASNGFITQEEANRAFEKKIAIFEGESIKNNNTLLASGMDYFVDYIEEQVIDALSADELYQGGLQIYTTLSQPIQEACYDSMSKVLKQGEESGTLPKETFDSFGVKQPQGAVVAIDPKTGEILAMVGGREYTNTKFNRCLALRQPGSSFKVFPYTAAVDAGLIAPESREVSEYINIDGWRPKEWSGGFFGPMSIRRAIQISSNIVAVKVALKAGLENVVKFAEKMGIKTELLPVPSIALGSVDVRPIDMASSFGTIANEGRYIEPTGILKIEKSGAESDYFAHSSSSEQVISPQAAWIMTQLLKAPISPGGTASSLGIPGLYAAGKTGTTENYKDGWFVGYTKGISIAVYVGSDSREVDLSYIRNYGSEYAGKIWKNVMQTLYNAAFPVKLENTNWMKPEGIVTIRVCNETGLRANETCPYHLETRINGMYPSYCQKKHPPPVEDNEKDSDEKEDSDKSKEESEKKEDEGEEKSKNPGSDVPPKQNNGESGNSGNTHSQPSNSFRKPVIADTGDFSVSFSSQVITVGSTVVVDFSVWDPNASLIELYVNGSLVAVLNEYPYRYYFSPRQAEENVIQMVLRDSSKNILGNKIIPIYVYPS